MNAHAPIPLDIAPMLPADLDAVLAIEKESFPEAAWSRKMFEQELDSDTARILVARQAEPAQRILGYISWRRFEDEFELLNLAVDTSARERGIGKTLVDVMIAAARRHDVRKIHLEVRADNQPAINLYKRCEFFPNGRRRGYYGTDQDALLMTWTSGDDASSEANVDIENDRH